LNISNIDINSFKLDLYKLNGLFLDFFFFFNRISNNYLSSGSSIEIRGTERTIEKQSAKEDFYLLSIQSFCNNDFIFIIT
jgi:hypothetical protein